jgi:hypothetical protein
MYMRLKLKKVDPAIDKRFLVALSGIMWSIVGIALCKLAFIWLSQSNANNAVWFGATGILLSLLIHHFGFLKLVDKNITRIAAKEGKVCVFAFQPWKSYLIIAIMIGMGIALRHSALPKPYLSIIYLGFGGAMMLSSLRYYRIFFKLIRKLPPPLEKGD